MHRSTILWLTCLATALSGCVVATKKQPTTTEHRTARREPPPPPPDEPVVRDHRAPPPPPRRPPPRRREWNPAGWVLLGEAQAQGGRGKDVIRLGARAGAFKRIMLVVEDADVHVHDIVVEYENGHAQSFPLKHEFREGSRTRAIDLKGASRVLRSVQLRYKDIPGGGKATLQIYGKEGDMADVPRPNKPRRGWDPAGWVKLGERRVEGGRDKDVIRVGARDGKFKRLMLVVEDSEVEIHDIVVEFGNGHKQSFPIKQFFREGTRTRPVDLKGGARVIKTVQLRYKNVKGGGQASVQVYGKSG